MINTVTLVGRLTKNADLRYTTSGKAVASFTLAVQGFKKEETDFINCVIWDKKAEALANFTNKGSKIGVVGSLKTRTYQGQDGKTVYVTEVLVDQMEFMDAPKQVEGQSFEQYDQTRIVPNFFQQNR
jgi:single-strand DNA-binding protein